MAKGNLALVWGGCSEGSELTPVSVCSYSSGGEDGYVRIHYFDPQYFDFELEA